MVRVKSESQLTGQCLGSAGWGLNQKKVRCWLFASAYKVCTAAFPQPRNREDQHVIWILYPVIGVFSMKNIVNRPTSWLPLVIPALQTGRLSLGAGWTIRINFRTALASLQDHLQKKKGWEKRKRRGGRREGENRKL